MKLRTLKEPLGCEKHESVEVRGERPISSSERLSAEMMMNDDDMDRYWLVSRPFSLR